MIPISQRFVASQSARSCARALSTSRLVQSHIGSSPIKYTSEVKIQHIPTAFSTTDSRFFERPRSSVENSELKRQRQMWGTTRALINNCVTGVTEGFSATLRFVGVGYRAALEGGRLALRLGYSHPISMEIPEGLKVTVPVPTRVLISGSDLQQVKLFAAKVREWKKPEPYNQKGIFINDETIRKKDGKKK
ncbi:50S ribosomal protein L6 [Kickxella alabastrina]|uniref:50S ribosomal protein L6 n=1 Tax=Kickxella alabastrina TaxID=61397 RepID=UPI00221FB1A1|nr:50S ribosomal protein L6 [Kickxella alabastrina]KAI7830096.1 50S ribosomal protein L6 [Kickxella alabastrina]